MKTQSHAATMIVDSNQNTYACVGNWSTQSITALVHELPTLPVLKATKLTINGDQIMAFDSAGALALLQFEDVLSAAQQPFELTGFNQQHMQLIDLLRAKKTELQHAPAEKTAPSLLEDIGHACLDKATQVHGFVSLFGDLSDKLFIHLSAWTRFRYPSFLSNLYTSGIQALPILALLSFLIGVVLAYQMGLQLETYGATSFIAYLSGMAVFREFGPLITAIIVAGRTSSAFTAQIGSMKINEEIDALQTMGFSPTELLVVPKVLALLVMFPLIIFWSDVFGILGAMLMSKVMLDVGFMDFLYRLQDSVGLRQLMLGLYKAPAFAILIALVGCFQGFRVESNADSLGTQTTRSVVQALFLIIIVDATYSIIYSWLDI